MMDGPFRLADAPPSAPRARPPLLSRGAVVAHRALAAAGGLEGMDGGAVRRLEAALGAALDLALAPPPSPASGGGGGHGPRRRRTPSAGRAHDDASHPGPTAPERAALAILPAIRRAAPILFAALREDELDRLEAEVRRAAAEALGE